jgi:hypothetical protein
MRVLDATLSAIQRNPNSYAIVLACFHASRAPKPWDDKG